MTQKKAHDVDNSDMLPTITSKIFEDNGCNIADGDKMQLTNGEIEDITTYMIKEPADEIASEWMGHALLCELMLPSVLHARDSFLKPNTCKSHPNDCKLRIEGANSSSSMPHWENTCEHKINPMKQLLLNERRKEACLETMPSDNACTNKHKTLSLDSFKCRAIWKFELVVDGVAPELIR